jgi:hypothetical protein
MHIKKILLGTVAATAISFGATAAPIVGGININSVSTSSSASPINVGQTFTVNGGTLTAGAGDFAAVPNGTTITSPLIFTAMAGQAFNFTSIVGSFVGNVTNASLTLNPGQRVVNVFISGTFTPAGVLSAFGANSETLITYSVTQTGAQESSSGSLNAVTAVPAPMSLALFGLGLAGLGMAMRRKA